MIAWYRRAGGQTQICLSDNHYMPIKLICDTEGEGEARADRRAIFLAQISEFYGGGAFLNAGKHQFFLRKTDIKNLGTKILVQIQKPATGNKHARVTDKIILENHFCLYQLNSNKKPEFSQILRDDDAHDSLEQKALSLNLTGFYFKPTCWQRSKSLIFEQGARLKAEGQEILTGAANKAVGLIAPAPIALKQALCFPIAKFFTENKSDNLPVANLAKKMGVEIEIATRAESKDYLEEAFAIQDNHIHYHQGVEIICEKTVAFWSIDINRGSAMAHLKNPEIIAFETNHAIVKPILMLIMLKNMRGTIIIDFITMRKRSHRMKIFTAMKAEMKNIEPLVGSGGKLLTLHGWTKADLFEIQTS